MARKNRVQVVGELPPEAWESLTLDEKDLLFLVDDFLDGRHTLEKFRERLRLRREAEEMHRALRPS